MRLKWWLSGASSRSPFLPHSRTAGLREILKRDQMRTTGRRVQLRAGTTVQGVHLHRLLQAVRKLRADGVMVHGMRAEAAGVRPLENVTMAGHSPLRTNVVEVGNLQLEKQTRAASIPIRPHIQARLMRAYLSRHSLPVIEHTALRST